MNKLAPAEKWEKQNGFHDFISTRFHKKMVFSALSWELATNLPTSFEVYNHPVPFWEAGASSVLVLLYTSQKIMGGLRSKELMQCSTSSILPGPESTLDATASQDASGSLETEVRKNLVSLSANWPERFANPEKFCWLARWVFEIFRNYLDDPKNIQMVWWLTSWRRKCADWLQVVQII